MYTIIIDGCFLHKALIINSDDSSWAVFLNIFIFVHTLIVIIRVLTNNEKIENTLYICSNCENISFGLVICNIEKNCDNCMIYIS